MQREVEPEAPAPAKKVISGIKAWAEDDRPREKMVLKGINALSNAELVAILLRTGQKPDTALDLAKQVLKTVDHDLHQLSRLSIGDFTKFRGLGKAKAISLVAALELGRRKQATPPKSGVFIADSREAALMLQPKMADLRHEEFVVLFLNQANYLLHMESISIGGVAGTVADPKIIMKKALEHETVKMILCHNHPSGSLDPSPQDVVLTQKLQGAALLLDMRILDHLIVSSQGYYSFANHGKL